MRPLNKRERKALWCCPGVEQRLGFSWWSIWVVWHIRCNLLLHVKINE